MEGKGVWKVKVSGSFFESDVPVPPSHCGELNQRLADYEKDSGWLLTLKDLCAQENRFCETNEAVTE